MAKRQTSWNVKPEEAEELVPEKAVKKKPATLAKPTVPAPVADVEGEKEVMVGAMLPMKARTELKRLGAEHDKNQKQLLMEAIDKLLVSYGREPIFK